MYRDEVGDADARGTQLRNEVAALETRLAQLQADRSTIADVTRSERSWWRPLRNPWLIVAVVVAIGIGVYVGSIVRIVDHEIKGPSCP